MQQDVEQARTHFLEGVAHFEAHRLEAAERSFLDSLQRLPGRASTRINLAATRLRLGRSAEALAELEAVLDAEPQHADAWCYRAAALSDLGRHDEAVVCADRALAIEPRDAGAWFRRGHALEQLRRFDEALAFSAGPLAQDAAAWHRLGLLQHRGAGCPGWPARTRCWRWCQNIGRLEPRDAAAAMGRSHGAAAFQAIAQGADASSTTSSSRWAAKPGRPVRRGTMCARCSTTMPTASTTTWWTSSATRPTAAWWHR